MAADEPDRRIAAILAADMVGFSRLMGVDEIGTLTRLADARRDVVDPAISKHRGRIFKLMGDGMLAEFPSAVLALRCAMEIQNTLGEQNRDRAADEQVVLRIGVHQGEVILLDGDLLGDGVNLAARLEPLAEPGGICISGRVYEDATGKMTIAAEDLGERQLKNIQRPVRVLRLPPPGQSVPPTLPARPPQAFAPAFAPAWRAPAEPAEESERTMVRVSPGLTHMLIVNAPEGPHRHLPLDRSPLTIGRAASCGLVLDGTDISRTHCQIELRGAVATLVDLNSTNGTFLNGKRVQAPTPLEPGASIMVGGHTITYERVAARPPVSDETMLRHSAAK